MKGIFFVDQNGRIVYDIQGNSSFEVHNHSKGHDYTGVQLKLVRVSLSIEVGVRGARELLLWLTGLEIDIVVIANWA